MGLAAVVAQKLLLEKPPSVGSAGSAGSAASLGGATAAAPQKSFFDAPLTGWEEEPRPRLLQRVQSSTANDAKDADDSVFALLSGDTVAPGWADVLFEHPPLEGVAEDAWLPEAENMVLLDGPLEGAPAASLPPATIAPGVVDGPTSGDDECLRSAPKTAKVKWKRGVVRSKNWIASLVV